MGELGLDGRRLRPGILSRLRPPADLRSHGGRRDFNQNLSGANGLVKWTAATCVPFCGRHYCRTGSGRWLLSIRAAIRLLRLEGRAVILDTQRGLVQYVSEPEAVDVEFKFLASNMVDILNGNDDPTDGVEETSDIPPGPSNSATLTIGIDADIIDGNFLESITI